MLRASGVEGEIGATDVAELTQRLREMATVERAKALRVMGASDLPEHFSSMLAFAERLAAQPARARALEAYWLPTKVQHARLLAANPASGLSMEFWSSVLAIPTAQERHAMVSLAWPALRDAVSTRFEADQPGATEPFTAYDATILAQRQAALWPLELRGELEIAANRVRLIHTLREVQLGIERGDARAVEGWLQLSELVAEHLVQLPDLRPVTFVRNSGGRYPSTLTLQQDSERARALLNQAQKALDAAAIRDRGRPPQ
jgi:hypothetical protein